jgi:hypothetical protein
MYYEHDEWPKLKTLLNQQSLKKLYLPTFLFYQSKILYYSIAISFYFKVFFLLSIDIYAHYKESLFQSNVLFLIQARCT